MSVVTRVIKWADGFDSDVWRYAKHPFKRTFVYFITDGVFVKIGVADKVDKRLDQLQTGNARKLFVLVKIGFMCREAALSAEASLHEEFSEKRLVGEWFDIASDPNFFWYYFGQSWDYRTDEANKFIAERVAQTGYVDERYDMEAFKRKNLDWYDLEGKAAMEKEMHRAVELMSRRVFGHTSKEANANDIAV